MSNYVLTNIGMMDIIHRKRKLQEQYSAHSLYYQETRQQFYNELEFLLPFLHRNIIIDKKAAEDIITSIQNGKVNYKKDYILKCVVVEINKKPTLCHVVWSSTTSVPHIASVSQILSVQETFDVLVELHMSKKYLPTTEKTLKKLCTCYIHPVLVKIFFKACKICNNCMKSEWTPLHKLYKSNGAVTIIPAIDDDCGFNKILVYVDTITNFTLLRPLKTNLINEVAFELFSIFTDFGIPEFIECHDIAYFRKVMKIVKTLKLHFRVPVAAVTPIFGKYKLRILSEQIRNMLNVWMEKSGSRKWAFGLHIVQWWRNTNFLHKSLMRSKLIDDIQSPYHAKFGILPQREIMRSEILPKENLIICSQCNQTTYKVFLCHNCKSACHITCCRRFVQIKEGVTQLMNECNKCTKFEIDDTQIGQDIKIEKLEEIESGTILGI